MKLEINSIEIKKDEDVIKTCPINHYVRISIGDYMYFDSPITTQENAQNILDNLDRRIE